MSERFLRRVSFASGFVLLAVVFFGYGLATERYQIWPYGLLHASVEVAKSYLTYGEMIPEGRRVAAPPGAPRANFTIHRADRIADGYYFLTGWRDSVGLYGSWLFDQTGTLRHVWQFDYAAMDPDGPRNGGDMPHPAYLLEDGSVIVAFDDGDIMARVDACSEPMWVKHGIYHHSLTRADDGTFWTWRSEGTPDGHFHYAENFDPADGTTIASVALVEDVIANAGPRAAAFGVRPDYPFEHYDETPSDQVYWDIFHPNDVDVLSAELAPMFPMFAPGDLLLSLRNVDLVAVVDPRTYAVKWWSQGPWIAQHDPDFTADGRISVFNNNPRRGQSGIVKIDPQTHRIANDPFAGEVQFFSETMGKHQYLPNGNVLIVVPGEGRILELTADGWLVLEFNNVAAEAPSFNDHVEDGMWVPPGYLDRMPGCER